VASVNPRQTEVLRITKQKTGQQSYSRRLTLKNHIFPEECQTCILSHNAKDATLEVLERLSTVRGRERATTFLFITYGGLLFCTIVIILFQGFNFLGFQLESSFLHWLGVATIGEICTLGSLVYAFFFRKS
jgi:hypothetical protein